MFKKEYEEKFLFCENYFGKPECLVCQRQLLRIKKQNMQRHYESLHKEYKEITGDEREALIYKLKRPFYEKIIADSEKSQSKEPANNCAKTSVVADDGEFLKELSNDGSKCFSARRNKNVYNRECELNFLFCENYFGKPECLVCQRELSHMKKFNIQRHYQTRHIEYEEITGDERKALVMKLKKAFNEKLIAESKKLNLEKLADNCVKRKKVTVVAAPLVKRCRSLDDGEFLKERNNDVSQSFRATSEENIFYRECKENVSFSENYCDKPASVEKTESMVGAAPATKHCRTFDDGEYFTELGNDVSIRHCFDETSEENLFYKECQQNFLFCENYFGKPECMVCQRELSHKRKYNMQRHYQSFHKEYADITGNAREVLINKLKKTFKEKMIADSKQYSKELVATEDENSFDETSEENMFNKEYELNLLFCENYYGKPECLVCQRKLSQVKKYNMQRHYYTRHAEFEAITGDEREALVTQLKKTFKGKIIADTKKLSPEKLAVSCAKRRKVTVVPASLVKRSRSFDDREFLKERNNDVSKCLSATSDENLYDRECQENVSFSENYLGEQLHVKRTMAAVGAAPPAKNYRCFDDGELFADVSTCFDETPEENRFYRECQQNFLFYENYFGKPECMVCQRELSHKRKYNMQRHYQTFHKEYEDITGDEREALINKLKKTFDEKMMADSKKYSEEPVVGDDGDKELSSDVSKSFDETTEENIFNKEYELNLLFCQNYFGKPECLICQRALSQVKKYNMQRHYYTRHKDYEAITGGEREALLIQLKKAFNKKMFDTSTSLRLKNLQRGKDAAVVTAPHDGEFLQELSNDAETSKEKFFYRECQQKFLFCKNYFGKPECLVCQRQWLRLKKYDMLMHYQTCHKEYEKITGDEREALINKLKKIFNEKTIADSKKFSSENSDDCCVDTKKFNDVDVPSVKRCLSFDDGEFLQELNNDVSTSRDGTPEEIPRVEKVVFDNRIKRKNVLALNEKVAAIREYEKRPVYKRIGRMFHCSPDQIKRIMQQKETILNAWEQRTRKSRDAKTLEMKVVKVSMLGKAVYEWIRRMMYYKDILITDGLIQKMALQFKSAMGLQNFFPHQEWCDKFRTTYKIQTCDSKMLSIGYAQGHSVQIKDVMKDVLSECSPDAEDDDDDDPEGIDEGEEEQENGNCENDCMILDSDEGEKKVKSKLKTKIADTHFQSVMKTAGNSNSMQIMSSAQLQGIRQLVALPIQTNGLAGMPQKVLVATPIVAPGQKQGSTPMTMTIIPLASLAPPSNTANPSATQTATASLASNSLNNINSNNCAKDQHVSVPTPILEIKKEIKTEPKDDEEEEINIKKEYLTDDEDVSNTSDKLPQSQMSTQQTSAPTHIVAIPLANKEMLEESTNDSLDDLSLSSLRKRIKIEGDSAEQNISERNATSPPPLASISATPLVSKSAEMPPLPPLTKAPTPRNAPPTNAALTTEAIPALTPLPVLNRSSHKRLRSDDDQTPLPPIRSYAEGRKYLKLLEDFALERENFRLIGLITRADEVLRELDRKENNEDEDDVEID